MSIPKNLTLKPFDLPVRINRFFPYQSFKLTDFEGASILVDLRAVGTPGHADHANFECQIRIGEINQKVFATAKEVLIVQEATLWEHEVEHLSVPELKERLRRNEGEHVLQGLSHAPRCRILELVRDFEERRQPASWKVVAEAGQKGLVVKPLYVDSAGDQRIDVSFQKGQCTTVFAHQVELSDPLPSTGKELIGKGSTYQITGGSIIFNKQSGVREQEYFLSSSPQPAVPGVLVPWRRAFSVHHSGFDRQSEQLFSVTDSVECHVHAKLEMKFVRHDTNDAQNAHLETPEPKSKRACVRD